MHAYCGCLRTELTCNAGVRTPVATTEFTMRPIFFRHQTSFKLSSKVQKTHLCSPLVGSTGRFSATANSSSAALAASCVEGTLLIHTNLRTPQIQAWKSAPLFDKLPPSSNKLLTHVQLKLLAIGWGKQPTLTGMPRPSKSTIAGEVVHKADLFF